MNHPNSRSGIDAVFLLRMSSARVYSLSPTWRHRRLCATARARSAEAARAARWGPDAGNGVKKRRRRGLGAAGNPLGEDASRRNSERVLRRRQIVQMAGGKVAAHRGTQGRLLGAAALEGIGTAGVKAAALGRIDGTWHVALEEDARAWRAGLRDRNSR